MSGRMYKNAEEDLRSWFSSQPATDGQGSSRLCIKSLLGATLETPRNSKGCDPTFSLNLFLKDKVGTVDVFANVNKPHQKTKTSADVRLSLLYIFTQPGSSTTLHWKGISSPRNRVSLWHSGHTMELQLLGPSCDAIWPQNTFSHGL